MERPLVTIGLLTYNHEKYIASALEGILSQKYQPIELIILDDASNDRTPLIIEQYMERMKAKFERVISLKNKKNSGNISRNCNCIIRKAKGIFYYEISGDDVLLPDAVNLLSNALQKHPECGLVHANMILVHDSYTFGNKIDRKNVIVLERESEVEPPNLFQQLMYGNCIAAPTVMLYKELFDKYGYHDENIGYEDYEYWLRLSRGEKFYFLKEPVILYRKAETSITNFEGKKNFDRLQIAIDADFSARKKYINELKWDEQIKSWQAFYSYYTKLCIQYQYQDGLSWLEARRKEDGIYLDEYQVDYEKQIRRRKREAEILNIWNNIDRHADAMRDYLKRRNIYNVAIYGYSQMGRILENKLRKVGISVRYIIDNKGEMLGCQLPVYTIEKSLPLVDAIVVAPVGLCKIVESLLKLKTTAKIIDLDQMMEDLYPGKFDGKEVRG